MACRPLFATLACMSVLQVLGSDSTPHDPEATHATPPNPYVITLFFRPLTTVKPAPEDILKYRNDVGAIHMALINQQALARRISGIYACHEGLIAASDFNGQLTFPRTSADESIVIYVATQIIPVVFHGRTIDHFILNNDPKAIKYRCNRTQKSSALRAQWHVTKEDVVPFEKISLTALVIFADPAHVYLLEGDYTTDQSNNMILPDLLVDTSASLPLETLRALQINRFFMPPQPWIAHAPEHYALLIA